MIVALDATPLTIGTGGVSRYTWQLANALANQFPDDQYFLVSDQHFPLATPLPVNLLRGPSPQNAAERRWWLWGLRKAMERTGTQMFHGTDFSVPYTRSVPSVMTLHDLSPWLEPSWQPDAGRVRRRTPRLLRHGFARMVITPTDAIRRAAIAHFHLDPAAVVAVPHAPSTFANAVHRKAPTPFFLFVGTLEPRKNVTRLIEAWRSVYSRFQIPLKIVGRTRADFQTPVPEPGLELLGELPDDALPSLYANATAVLYPSLYEGFGLPVLEAMAHGALVITSRDPAILEVAGTGNAIHVDAEDTHALTEAMTAAAQNPHFAPVRERALARAAQFTWASTAQLTREVYQEALARRGRS